MAETVEIAPGIQVTRNSYSAPANEQPFFGFEAKTAAQREADEKFVKALVEATGSREKAVDEVSKRGWRVCIMCSRAWNLSERSNSSLRSS